jgi:hypothetical protein
MISSGRGMLTTICVICVCRAGELQDLIGRLQLLAATAGGAPLMTVQQPGRASSASDAAVTVSGAGDGAAGSDAAADGAKADDWELV